MVSQTVGLMTSSLRPPAGLLLVATLRAEPIGCGALKFHDDAPVPIVRLRRGVPIQRRALRRT